VVGRHSTIAKFSFLVDTTNKRTTKTRKWVTLSNVRLWAHR
jgi:hypothetical protein